MSSRSESSYTLVPCPNDCGTSVRQYRFDPTDALKSHLKGCDAEQESRHEALRDYGDPYIEWNEVNEYRNEGDTQ